MQSCETNHTGGGCPKYATNYQTLSTSAINQTPYFTNKAFDTISFVSNKGDTLTFVKTKTDTTWYCEDDNSNPNCPKEKANCYQALHNTYNTIKGVGSFDVKHSRKGYGFNNGIEITMNNTTFLFGDDQVGLSSYWTFKNEITINNTTFNNLIVIYPNSYDSLTAEGYINKNSGLFFFNNKNTDTKWLIN